MAQFSINIGGFINNPPNQIGDITLTVEHNSIYTFSVSDFTTGTNPVYSDPEGDAPYKVKILSLPSIGTLQYNSNPVIQDLEIDITDINSLNYVTDNRNDAYNTSFDFTVSDVGSQGFSNLTGLVTFQKLKAPNEPPTQVGDNEVTIEYAETLVFTRDMFTTQTTPPYSDPEGDAALNLKITSLPSDGNIQLNGSNVTLNQIIPFTSIDSGLLTYVPGLDDTDGDLETFQFEIADEGSGEFVG